MMRSRVERLVTTALAAAVGTVTFALPLVPAHSSHRDGAHRVSPHHNQPTAPLRSVFGPTSEWRRDVRSAPIDADSGEIVANLAAQVDNHWGGVAAFNAYQYNVSTYTVRAGVPLQKVVWDDCQGKSYVPAQLYDPRYGAHFRNVPIPAGAVPATGTDGELSIYDPRRDTLWEFWKAHRAAGGWHACWGGRINHVSRSPGFFPDGMGVTATGLSAVGGAVGIREARRGVIKHALGLNVIDAATWSEVSYPAQRSDGAGPAGSADLLREGQRLRLDPTLDVRSLHLHPIAEAVALAAQRYGFIVNDKGGAVAVIAESGNATAARTGRNPWDSLLRGTPSYAVLRGFPWSRLQVLPVDYGKH